MSRKRILLIDGDERLLHDVVAAAETRGFDAVSTASSNDGFELARAERPDLIVVNVELQPTNGWSVCTKLKKDEELKGIPVILTSSTSTADTFEKHKKLKTRADEYLLKPYQPTDIVRLAGEMLGVPEAAPEEEAAPLGGDDEPLALTEETAEGEAELIAVGDDEPLEAVEDPLATGADDLAPADDGGELAGSDSSGEEVSDPLATGEESLQPMEDEALAAAALTDEAPLSDDQSMLSAHEADDLSAFDQSFESMGNEEIAVADEHGLEAVTEEGTLVEEALPYEEAPLEIPADESASDAEPLAENAESGDSPFGETAFSEHTLAIAVEPPESRSTAELEARVAALEAELAGYREADASRDAESERLQGELSKKDREILDLREQLHAKDKAILDLKESEARVNGELAKAKEDRTRREATVKSLTTKAEQLTQQAAKLQKDLLAAREEAKGGAALKAKVAELEKVHAEAEAHKARLAGLEAELDAAKRDLEAAKADAESVRSELDETKFARDQAQGEADGLRQDLEEARKTAERALQNAVALQEKLAQADGRAESHAAKVRSHEDSLARTRESLQKLLGELGA